MVLQCVCIDQSLLAKAAARIRTCYVRKLSLFVCLGDGDTTRRICVLQARHGAPTEIAPAATPPCGSETVTQTYYARFRSRNLSQGCRQIFAINCHPLRTYQRILLSGRQKGTNAKSERAKTRTCSPAASRHTSPVSSKSRLLPMGYLLRTVASL